MTGAYIKDYDLCLEYLISHKENGVVSDKTLRRFIELKCNNRVDDILALLEENGHIVKENVRNCEYCSFMEEECDESQCLAEEYVKWVIGVLPGGMIEGIQSQCANGCFISFESTTGLNAARTLEKALKDRGVSVFCSASMENVEWKHEIFSKLKCAGLVFLMETNEYHNSENHPFCALERDYSFSSMKRIVRVGLQKERPLSPGYIDDLQYKAYVGPSGAMNDIKYLFNTNLPDKTSLSVAKKSFLQLSAKMGDDKIEELASILNILDSLPSRSAGYAKFRVGFVEYVYRDLVRVSELFKYIDVHHLL